jgi:hypothetical protein
MSTKAVIAYDRDLPEIPDRRPWEKPTSYLVKDETAATGWREEKARVVGRSPFRTIRSAPPTSFQSPLLAAYPLLS